MDALQHLASGDSFSYRWFLNIKPAFDINNTTDDDASSSSYDRSSSLGHSSYIDMDPNLLQLRRPSDASAPDSNFNFPAAQPLTTLLHADQLFSSGHLMPFQLLSPPKFQTPSPPPPAAHLSSNLPPSEFSKNFLSLSNPQSQFIQKCRRWSSKRIFHKYLGFLRPLYRKVCGKRPHPRMVNCVESLQATPRTSITISASEWCHNNLLFESDIENLIYEAVLHCKKSTGETV